TAILWPVFVQAFATIALYIVMSRVRVAAVKAGKVEARAFKYMDGEPEELRNYTRALANQFESPVLFYTACILAYITGTANIAVLVLAWGYALAKLGHVYVHATANRLKHRRPTFIVAFGCLILLWGVLAVSLAMK
ncbi:MAG: MAPEG family protein, partial [Notoacmeibacter sp.]